MMLDGLCLYFYLLYYHEGKIVKQSGEPVFKVSYFYIPGTDMTGVKKLASEWKPHIKSLPVYKENAANYDDVQIVFEAEGLTSYSLEEDDEEA